MKSLTKLSKELKIQKPPLLNRMRKADKNFKQKYCFKKNNQLYIKDAGIKLINYQKHNSNSNNFHTRHGSSTNQITKADLLKRNQQLTEALNRLSRVYDRMLRPKNLLFTKPYQQLMSNRDKQAEDIDSYNNKGRIYRFFHKMPK